MDLGLVNFIDVVIGALISCCQSPQALLGTRQAFYNPLATCVGMTLGRTAWAVPQLMVALLASPGEAECFDVFAFDVNLPDCPGPGQVSITRLNWAILEDNILRTGSVLIIRRHPNRLNVSGVPFGLVRHGLDSACHADLLLVNVEQDILPSQWADTKKKSMMPNVLVLCGFLRLVLIAHLFTETHKSSVKGPQANPLIRSLAIITSAPITQYSRSMRRHPGHHRMLWGNAFANPPLQAKLQSSHPCLDLFHCILDRAVGLTVIWWRVFLAHLVNS